MKCLSLSNVQRWRCQEVMLYFCKSISSLFNDTVSRMSYTHSYMDNFMCSWMKDSLFLGRYGNTLLPTACASPCCHNHFGECLYQPLETQSWKKNSQDVLRSTYQEGINVFSGVTNTFKKSHTFPNSFGKGVKNVTRKLGLDSGNSGSKISTTSRKWNISVSQAGNSHSKDAQMIKLVKKNQWGIGYPEELGARVNHRRLVPRAATDLCVMSLGSLSKV